MLFDNTMKWVDSFVPMDTEVVEGSKSQSEGSKKRTREELESDNSKKQKIDENKLEIQKKNIKFQRGLLGFQKGFHDDLGVNIAKNEENILSSYYCLYTVIAAGIKVNAAGYNC
ncbi:hypothetical protein Tco_1321138 [Tanacetum coccineum]